MSSISNMPAEVLGVKMSGTDDYVWDHYQESVKMSTYLVAFVVSKFEFKETIKANNIRFRVWSNPDLLDQSDYALQLGAEILEYFEEYYDVDYPLPKQDIVAIPDFVPPGMENWGLITFKESSLMLRSDASPAYKQKIAALVSHEIAHQWFGKETKLSKYAKVIYRDA